MIMQVSKKILMQVKLGRKLYLLNNMCCYHYGLLVQKILRTRMMMMPVYVSANESDKFDSKKHDEKAKKEAKGKILVGSPIGVRDLRAEIEEFSFNSTNRVNAVSAPVNAAGPNPTTSTNSFNTAGPFDTVVSPNFRISGKSSFVDPFKYPNDPDMPELE
nr:hypothetical protein [Tanacetum cinerariifolium]